MKNILYLLFQASIVALFMLFATHAASAQDFKFIEVTVLDENGKPMSDVTVDVKMDGLEFPMPTNAAGMISMNVASSGNPVELRISKSGYELQKVRWRRAHNVPAEHTINMQLGKPQPGWVVDARGEPVADAEVYAVTPEGSLTFLNGKSAPNVKQKPIVADEQGKFTLPYLPEGSTIVCLSDNGWAQLVKSKQREPLEIQLTDWGNVQLLTKQANTKVGLHFLRMMPKDRGKVTWIYEGVTDAKSRFSYDRVIPGNVMAYQEVPLHLVTGQPKVPNRSHGIVMNLKPDIRNQITLGSANQQATGKLIQPADYIGKMNWKSGYVVLSENNVVDLAMRTMIFEYGKLLGQSGVSNPNQRVPPSLEPNYLVRYITQVKDDGSFIIDGVPPGQYKLSACVPAQPEYKRNKTNFLQIAGRSFNIPKLDAKASFDLGEHILELADDLAE